MSAQVRLCSGSVTDHETAVLVLKYLDAQGCARTSAVFKKEAKKLLQAAATAPLPNVKTLQDVLVEYVALQEQEAKRQALLHANPVAASLYSLLDCHAGLPAPQTLPPAFYQLAYAAPPEAPAQLAPHAMPFGMLDPLAASLGLMQHSQAFGMQQLGQPVMMGSGAGGMVPVGASPVQAANNEAVRPQHTPGRHALRKGAPRKRRKLGNALDAAGASPGGGDLLNTQMAEDGLATLMNDPGIQTRWAENMATHITHAYFGHQSLDDALPLEPAPSDPIQYVLDDIQADPNFDKLFGVLLEGALIPSGEGLHSPVGHVTHASQQEEEQEQQQEQQHAAGNAGEPAGGPAPTIPKHAAGAVPTEGAIAATDSAGEGGDQPGSQQQVDAVDDPVARYMDNPEDFEDLINECLG